MNGRYQVGSGRIVAVTHDTPFIDNSIPQSAQDVKKKIMHKSRAPVSAPYASPTAQNVVTNIEQAYKPTFSDKTLTSRLATQIALTNEQAGIEYVGRKYGIKNIEAMVQAARVASNQASEMISGEQIRLGSDSKNYLGEGLQRIIAPLIGTEKYAPFCDYLLHYHNADRITLEERSKAELEALEAEIKRSDAYREKQDAKWGDAMAEIESYLSTHTRADTIKMVARVNC